MSKKQPIYEYEVTPEEARAYVVVRPFRLKVRNGPLEAVQKGDTVYLSQRTAAITFAGCKVEPLELGKFFRCIWPIQVVTPSKEWLDAKPGDIVELERDEAIKFLRQRFIVEVDEKEAE